MRTTLTIVCLAFVLSMTTPAEAQFRETAEQNRTVQTQLYDSASDAANAIQSLFGAEHFRMSHTYEASFSSFGGNTSSMGMYTNTMMWQFNSDWAARMDVSMAHPLAQNNAFGQQEAQVYLRNAEVAYKPSENVQVRLQVQQSPHGRYMSPYGRMTPYGSPYRAGSSFQATPTDQLFWRN